ncbi:hydroxylysine kinase [Drosophila obscura]|uniref:hydroxylysine kinase n=1 Tax=Drosophila obscura TaxID=7282 RepID=UPI001BB2BDE9|nr:hydroxylysine kinase [Drosophila obscura]XP_022214802.2 hydroxylysine kinase [Drosophila obscura]XP_022214803.2 hydroxylysine kinase [Drosophila obscura]
MEQWNNVELTNMSKKSYTLNHAYNMAEKLNKENAAAVTSNGNGSNDSIPAKEQPESSLLKPGSDVRPKVEPDDVESLLRRLYGITVSEVKEILAYDDRNFLIHEDSNVKNPLIVSHCPNGYVLKIMNSLDSKKEDVVDAQNQVMLYLSKKQIKCPRPIANASGKYYSVEKLSGTAHVVRLLEFVPGQIFREVPITKYLLFQSGEYLAKLDRTLKDFTHEAYVRHTTTWQLQNVPGVREFLFAVKDQEHKALCEEVIDAFESKVLSVVSTLEHQIIHGDFNESNIVIEPAPNQTDHNIKGVIDFGDASNSPLLFEVGIALTYMTLEANDLASGGIFLAGYTSIKPISSTELGYLKYCVAARLVQSLVMGLYTHSLHPTNDYLLSTQQDGWKLLETLWRESFESVDELWSTTGHQYLTQSNK